MAAEANHTRDFSDQVLGQGDEVIRCNTLAEQIAASDRLVAQAMHSVRILSHDTEPEIYGRDEFIALLTSFITRRSRVARIRILIADPARAVRYTHRLVLLWQRFPSFIDLRELRDEYARTRENFLLVDDIGLIRRPEHETPVSVITFRNLNTGRERAAWFDEAFARGAASVALRRLSL